MALYPGPQPQRPCPGLLSCCPSGAPERRTNALQATAGLRWCFKSGTLGPPCLSTALGVTAVSRVHHMDKTKEGCRGTLCACGCVRHLLRRDRRRWRVLRHMETRPPLAIHTRRMDSRRFARAARGIAVSWRITFEHHFRLFRVSSHRRAELSRFVRPSVYSTVPGNVCHHSNRRGPLARRSGAGASSLDSQNEGGSMVTPNRSHWSEPRAAWTFLLSAGECISTTPPSAGS